MFDNISYQGNANFILLFYVMCREGCSVGKPRGPRFRFTAHTQKLGMVEESCDPTIRRALWEDRTASQQSLGSVGNHVSKIYHGEQ